jgi:hypothetical protein
MKTTRIKQVANEISKMIVFGTGTPELKQIKLDEIVKLCNEIEDGGNN